MIHKNCEFLSDIGWTTASNGRFVSIKKEPDALTTQWSQLRIEPFDGIFHEFEGRFFSACVQADYALPVISYGASIHGNDRGFLVPAFSADGFVAVNNFVTQNPVASNPCIANINSHNPGCSCNDGRQFRLIPDIVKFNRFADIAKHHGRSTVYGLNRELMHGVIEFANYPAHTIDQIELSALGDNRRIERLSPKRLRVYPDRYRLKIPKPRIFSSQGYKVSGNYDFLIVRYKGKIAIL